MKRKTGFTKEQHFELGDKLKHMYIDILDGYVAVENNYPRTSKQVRAMKRAYETVSEAKSVMDDAICGELPMSDHDAVKAYFGEPRRARQ